MTSWWFVTPVPQIWRRPFPNGLGTRSNAPRQMVPARPAAISIPPSENVVTTTRGQVAIRPMTTLPNTMPATAPKTTASSSDGIFGQPRTWNWLDDVAAIHQYR